MLKRLIGEQGWPIYDLARATGVSATSLYRWMDEDVVPHIGNAVAVARALKSPDLLYEWGYEAAADVLADELVQQVTTEEVEVANGWRLETLIAEVREQNKLLRRLVALAEPTYPIPEKESDNADVQ